MIFAQGCFLLFSIMPPKPKYRTDAKKILCSVPDCNIIVSIQYCKIDSITLVSVELKSVIEYNRSVGYPDYLEP